MYRSLESHATRLESDNTESRLKLFDLNDRVAAQSEIIDQLKVYNVIKSAFFLPFLLSLCAPDVIINYPIYCILRLI